MSDPSATAESAGRPADPPRGARATGTKVSLRDVAVAAGVSPAAVSKVIRNAYGVSPGMRERVQAAIDELGYRPRFAARAMRGSSFTIGLEVPELSNDYFSQVVRGAAGRLATTPYHLIVTPGLGYLSGESVLESLVDRQVDGIIAIASQVSTRDLEAIGAQVPLVLLGRHDTSDIFDTVTNDDRVGTQLALDHLLELGHRRIVHLTIAPVAHSPHEAREAQYRDSMAAAGFEARVVHVRTVNERTMSDGATSDDADDDLRAVVTALLAESPRPTAIFAGHDTLALEVLRVTVEAGLGPDEVSVVGYDRAGVSDHPLVDLTTVDQSGPTMGATAIQLLLERISGQRTAATQHRITPTLRVGGTSAAPRRG